MRRFLLLLMLAVLALPVTATTIYKWVDENGVTQYSQSPPSKQKAQELRTQPTPRDTGAEREKADGYFKQVTTNIELFGCWKRINFSESAMKRMNQTEPYILPHQWYCFLENGKYWDLYSNRDDGGTIENKLKMMTVFPGQDYSIPREGIVHIHHPDTNQDTYWVTSIVAKDVQLWGINIKRGDALMTIRNPRTGQDVYYRFMRKVAPNR